jgi:hypothetical protein
LSLDYNDKQKKSSNTKRGGGAEAQNRQKELQCCVELFAVCSEVSERVQLKCISGDVAKHFFRFLFMQSFIVRNDSTCYGHAVVGFKSRNVSLYDENNSKRASWATRSSITWNNNKNFAECALKANFGHKKRYLACLCFDQKCAREKISSIR